MTAPAKRGERVRNQSQSRTGDGPRTGCIIAEPGHPQTTAVMNPLSELIVDLYGTATASRTRSAIGVATVPQSPRGLLGRSRDRRPQTLKHFDQGSCTALPAQRSPGGRSPDPLGVCDRVALDVSRHDRRLGGRDDKWAAHATIVPATPDTCRTAGLHSNAGSAARHLGKYRFDDLVGDPPRRAAGDGRGQNDVGDS